MAQKQAHLKRREARILGDWTRHVLTLGAPVEEIRDSAKAAAHMARHYLRLRSQSSSRASIRAAYESCGMKRVRGALGGVYWE